MIALKNNSIMLSCAIILTVLLVSAAITSGFAAGGGGVTVPKQSWTFNGFFGTYDKAQLQRGFQVYKEVCAACHGMKYLSYRNLGESGGPGFSEAQIKSIAAEYEVKDGPNDEGELFERPARPSDRFISPFANEQEARAANNGAYPVDFSTIAKARNAAHNTPMYLEPFKWVKDIVTGYQEAGPDYIHSLLTGYVDPPKKFQLGDGMYYNKYYPGHQIAMAAPLSDELVEYSDGSPQTVEQYSRDVTAFLMWAADPKLEERKIIGFNVLLYLIVFSVILYLAKQRVWANAKH
ncbi:MAG: cytochrome c1 [Pseudomonadota bacterium]